MEGHSPWNHRVIDIFVNCLDNGDSWSSPAPKATMLSNTHFSMAVHVLSALAFLDGKLIGSDDLAATVGTNPSFLRGLIGRLKEAGLVETRLGKGGGSRIGRAAEKITLHDVYKATESRPALKTHVCDEESVCPVAAGMGALLSNVNDRIERAVQLELEQVTISDLITNYIKVDP